MPKSDLLLLAAMMERQAEILRLELAPDAESLHRRALALSEMAFPPQATTG